MFHYNYVIKVKDGLVKNSHKNELLESCIYKRGYIWISLFTDRRNIEFLSCNLQSLSIVKDLSLNHTVAKVYQIS